MSRQSGFNPPRSLWDDVPEDPDQPEWSYAATPRPPHPGAYQLLDPTASSFAPNARDDQSSRTNLPAALKTSQNCSLYITNLPATTTVTTLLDAPAHHGPFDRIYACHITPPNPALNLKPPTATAYLTTFTLGGASRLMHFIHTQCGLVLGTLTADAIWNRHPIPPPQLPAHCTRVLVIRGPRELVNETALAGLFRAAPHHIRFDTQHVYYADRRPGSGSGSGSDMREVTMVWQFGAYRAQAHPAREALLARWSGRVEVRFGADPCAAG